MQNLVLSAYNVMPAAPLAHCHPQEHKIPTIAQNEMIVKCHGHLAAWALTPLVPITAIRVTTAPRAQSGLGTTEVFTFILWEPANSPSLYQPLCSHLDPTLPIRFNAVYESRAIFSLQTSPSASNNPFPDSSSFGNDHSPF